MPRKRRSRVYWRNGRAWGDFRDFADVGGKLEPLVGSGESYATTDADVAAELASQKVTAYERRRRNKTVMDEREPARLGEYAAHHLREKAQAGKVADSWLASTELRLRSALDFLGDKELSTITTRDVQRWVAHLQRAPALRGKRAAVAPQSFKGTLSPGTVRHYLNALSNLYQRAQSEGYVDPGFNPVAAMLEKPTARRQEARWLEVHDAALLLESARTYQPKRGDLAVPNLYEIVACYLLTGGRGAEVLGLATDDISFDRQTVTFRPHPWRRLKTETSFRVVPLWGQLEEILRAYVFGGSGPRGRLLFPASQCAGPRSEQRIVDLRKPLDAIAERAGWKAGEIRSKMFRHTYTAARLQTLDQGAPVATFTVARELGHGGTQLVQRIYGHLGNVRHRAEAVEYRIEQHRAALGDRLSLLRS